MAIPPHLRLTLVGRGEGQSVIAYAAYRSAQALYNEREQKTLDYRRKKGVLYSEIFAPENAPEWVKDREKLWNAVEAIETRKNSRYAREFTIALPRQLTLEQNKALIREYITENFVQWGMIADLSIHESKASDGGTNPHAHILVSLRDIHWDGFGEKNRTWDHNRFIHRWRAGWQEHANRHLEMAGHSERIDMRSYDQQAKDTGTEPLEPTEHLGYELWNYEEKGEESLIGASNRMVKHRNRLRQMARERKQLAERELFDEMALYLNAGESPRNLREAAGSASGSSGSTLREIAKHSSGSGGSHHKRPDGQAPPYFMQQSRSQFDPAMQEGVRRHQEALQRAYGHRHVGAIMRTAMRNRVTQWKSRVRERSQEIFSHFAKLWKHSRDAHGHMRKEKDRGYER